VTSTEFAKRKWQHSELIVFTHPRFNNVTVECMLIAVDFDQELLKLEPMDKSIYEEIPFWSRIEYCECPRPKLKIVKSNKDK